MTALEKVKPGAMLRGVVPGHSVRIVSVDWIGNQAVNVVYREPDGGVSETTRSIAMTNPVLCQNSALLK